MNELTIELCPETGICSLVKPGSKTDLLPGEVAEISAAGKGPAAVREAIAAVDAAFAARLSDDEIREILSRFTK